MLLRLKDEGGLKWIFLLSYFLFQTFLSPLAQASIQLEPGDFTNPDQLLTDDLTKNIVQTIGLASDHRPYQSATALGTSLGLDLGLEVTLVQLTPQFKDTMDKAGLTSDTPQALPIPKIHLHKGLGSRVDIGVAGASYKHFRMGGADLKVVVYQPTEGLTWAMRVCYGFSSLGMVKTQTWTPQILVSKKLSFADPYLGIGLQNIRGKIAFDAELIAFPGVKQHFSNTATSRSFQAFLGLPLILGPTGIKITMEGSYSSIGVNTLGTKVGFEF